MTEVDILTPRGVILSGTFTDPVDSTDAAVIFSHPLLCDRQSTNHYRELAARYRARGFATLLFDYSGHGLSSDDPITMDRRTEDLRAASGWLADQGFSRQLLHAHSTGSISALRSNSKWVRALFLSSPITGPMSFDWEAIFSPQQLEELERDQRTRVPDDSDSPRTFFEVIPQTLLDLSLNREEELLDGLTAPTLIVFDRSDMDRGGADTAPTLARLLPEGSMVEVARESDFSKEENLTHLADLADRWARRFVSPRPETT